LICLKIFGCRLPHIQIVDFAKITLAEDEYRLYRNLLISSTKKCLSPISTFTYIKTRSVCCKISRKEAEATSKKIPAEYLDKINSGYLDYIKSQTELNVLIIDVSDRDFVKPTGLPYR
jgi:deoxyadenosine/deoxycytidine kinase